MSRGSALPMNSPIAWVYLQSGDCTICWRRGDKVAYIFDGRQLHTYPDDSPTGEVLAMIPVLPAGWTDLAQVRRTGENWMKARRKRCETCRTYQ